MRFGLSLVVARSLLVALSTAEPPRKMPVWKMQPRWYMHVGAGCLKVGPADGVSSTVTIKSIKADCFLEGIARTPSNTFSIGGASTRCSNKDPSANVVASQC